MRTLPTPYPTAPRAGAVGVVFACLAALAFAGPEGPTATIEEEAADGSLLVFGEGTDQAGAEECVRRAVVDNLASRIVEEADFASPQGIYRTKFRPRVAEFVRTVAPPEPRVASFPGGKAWTFRVAPKPGPLVASLFLEGVHLKEKYRAISEPRLLFDLEVARDVKSGAIPKQVDETTLERIKQPFVNLGFDVQSAVLTPENRRVLRTAGSPDQRGLALLSQKYDAEILVTGLLSFEEDIWDVLAGADPNVPGSGFKAYKAQCSLQLKAVNLSTRTDLVSLSFSTRDLKDEAVQSGMTEDSPEKAFLRARDTLMEAVNPGKSEYGKSFVYGILEQLAARSYGGRTHQVSISISGIPHARLQDLISTHLRALEGVEFCKPRSYESGKALLLVVYQGKVEDLVASFAKWQGGALAVKGQADLVVSLDYTGKDAVTAGRALSILAWLSGGRLKDDVAFESFLRSVDGITGVEAGEKDAERGAKFIVRTGVSADQVRELALRIEACPDPKVEVVSISGTDVRLRVRP